MTKSPETASAPQSISERALATIKQPSEIVSLNGKQFSVKKRVTTPQLKQKDDQIVYIKITDKFYQGKEIESEKKKGMGPAMIANVIDLTCGQARIYIMAKVVELNLVEMYPDDEYVGLSFAIRKIPATVDADGKRAKRYNEYEILEIDESEASA